MILNIWGWCLCLCHAISLSLDVGNDRIKCESSALIESNMNSNGSCKIMEMNKKQTFIAMKNYVAIQWSSGNSSLTKNLTYLCQFSTSFVSSCCQINISTCINYCILKLKKYNITSSEMRRAYKLCIDLFHHLLDSCFQILGTDQLRSFHFLDCYLGH